MNTIRTIVVGCDHWGCDATAEVRTDGRTRAVTGGVKLAGWTHTEQRDYCPAHAKEHGDE